MRSMNFLSGSIEQYSIDEKKLILTLMAVRLFHGFERRGYSKDEAQAMTLELLQQRDFSVHTILSEPDGIRREIERGWQTRFQN
jgi:hypothetical protein